MVKKDNKKINKHSKIKKINGTDKIGRIGSKPLRFVN